MSEFTERRDWKLMQDYICPNCLRDIPDHDGDEIMACNDALQLRRGAVPAPKEERPWPGFCQACGAALNPPDANSCTACGCSDADE